MIDFTSRQMKIDLSFDRGIKCPFCGMKHPMYINGLVRDYHTGTPTVSPDKGYSFCNCKNIWYTDWVNIDQGKYKKYEDTEKSEKVAKENKENKFNLTISRLVKYKKDINSFLNIGSGKLFIEGLIKEHLGWDTTCVDLNKKLDNKGHKVIYGDICDDKVLNKLDKYDVIWASHVIEHLRYPLETLKKLKDKLTKGGLLYIITPDTYFIDYNRPKKFSHWWVHQHYILWDMGSLIKELKKMGYIVKLQKHNPNPLCQEFHLLVSNPTDKETEFMKQVKKNKVDIDLIDPNDVGHYINDIDKEHREGADKLKKLINQGKKILPIAVTYYGKRLDGFKRYIAYKELGYKKIPVVIGSEPGCQQGKEWVVNG